MTFVNILLIFIVVSKNYINKYKLFAEELSVLFQLIMEPMALGSPPSSPGQSPQSNPNFLPAFLMGDQQIQTSARQMQTPNKNQQSFGFRTPTSTHEKPAQNRFLQFNDQSFNMSNVGQVPEKPGPPALGLFDTLEPKLDFANSTRIDGRPFVSPMKEFELKSPVADKRISTPQIHLRNLNDSLSKSHPYKKQEAESLWVTVLGFPPHAASLVMSQLAHCGTIIDKKFPTDGNWVDIKFSNRHEVAKAMAYNGKLISNSVMIGVILHKAENKENSNSTSQETRHSIVTSPNRARSLTQPYVLSQNSEVLSPQNVPQRSTGIVTKAMEYVFGWT